MCVQGKRGPQGEQENLGQEEGKPGAPFFSFISEVTGTALSKVVKSICSREGGKEKKLVARGKGAQRENCTLGAFLSWLWCSQTGLADRMIDCFVKGPRVCPELEALCLS